ncbi:5-methylaminomethyl-2-thiouridylate-methyltransferase [Coprinopsis sp. MPI-PUGE-AT-0042]|nr:5-methylaminomethyl-2-thiouridylate-methyltransferase [Coprinopsis sp. MPI-PUGE-AT-0042]
MSLLSTFRCTRRACRQSILNAYYSRAYSIAHHEPRKGDKVVVGMSGGVDSSVAALLLAQKDYDLSAVYMRNWDTRDESGTDKGCEWEKDWEDVERVCRKLDVPVTLVDLSKEYWNRVFAPSLELWQAGSTPCPDVSCNREIKFGALLERLPSGGSGTQPYFATGHYARKVWSSSSTTPRPKLVKPRDSLKDQTYYLSSISEAGLSRSLFPLSDMTKPDVRALAEKHGLHTAQRPDSVGICFVGEKAKFHKFLSNYIPPKSGTIVDESTGRVVGHHEGLWKYTIGEASRLPGMPAKMPVSRKDPSTNTVYVVPGMNNEALLTNTIHVPSFSWIWNDSPPPALDTPDGLRVSVKHRYRMQAVPCTVRRSEQVGITISCESPEQSVAPGQVVVLYDGDWCLGCGVISGSEMVP